jgi:DNA end-binding protein Ku
MPAKRRSSPGSKGAHRGVWRGHITFGLVQVPVVLQSAENRHDLQFRLLDSRNHARIRYERINEVTGQEVPWNEVVKAYEHADDDYVVLSDADFKRAAVKATKTIEIEQFVDPNDISLMYFDTPYYLVPDKNGEKGYALLREALRKMEKVGIARVVIRTREYLSALGVEGNALVLLLLRFDQEIKDAPAELPPLDHKKSGVSARDLEMAKSLVESMSGEWEPKRYHDQYRAALKKWIEKRAKAGKTTPLTEAETPEESPGRIINITELLQKSLRGGGKGKTQTSGRGGKAHVARRKSAG